MSDTVYTTEKRSIRKELIYRLEEVSKNAPNSGA
jgi:hypothetical protein